MSFPTNIRRSVGTATRTIASSFSPAAAENMGAGTSRPLDARRSMLIQIPKVNASCRGYKDDLVGFEIKK